MTKGRTVDLGVALCTAIAVALAWRGGAERGYQELVVVAAP